VECGNLENNRGTVAFGVEVAADVDKYLNDVINQICVAYSICSNWTYSETGVHVDHALTPYY
jgi:hypothetical protein